MLYRLPYPFILFIPSSFVAFPCLFPPFFLPLKLNKVCGRARGREGHRELGLTSKAWQVENKHEASSSSECTSLKAIVAMRARRNKEREGRSRGRERSKAKKEKRLGAAKTF